jgi:hypothetical protein
MKPTVRLLVIAALAALAWRPVAGKQPSFAGRTETIRAAITAVDLEHKLLIVTSSAGVPYDFQLERPTLVQVAGAKAKLEDLTSAKGKEAEVTFRMLKTGNVALKIVVP